ncbi:MAG: hypothetical protein KTR32_05460 [Granulosicoccus sp.]|nr:hypothetical protein [Granulosicoccus sp.]
MSELSAENPLHKIERLAAEQVAIVAALNERGRTLQVKEAEGYRWLVNGGQSVQSLMAIDAPAVLLLPNHVAMLFGLLILNECKNVLSLGMGGACLERFLSWHFPNSGITSIEPDSRVVEYAQQYFGVPEGVEVVQSTAEAFVASTQSHYDFICCDIFEKEEHPVCLSSTGFYQDINSILRPDGVLALNLTPTSENELLVILKAIRVSFAVAYISSINDRGNVVVVATKGEVLRLNDIRSRAIDLSRQLDLSLSVMAEQFKLIPVATA